MQNTDTNAVDRVANVANNLGEGIVWHAATNAIYWLNVHPVSEIFSMDISSGAIRSRRLESDLYCLRRCSDGTMVGLSKFGLVWIDVAELTIVREHAILDAGTRYRFNDANCDSIGRLWTGTMIDNFQTVDGRPQEIEFSGEIYRISTAESVEILDGGFGCPNTFAWSPDEKTMYCADSCTGWIYAYDFDVASGSIGRRREFFSDDAFGIPDGSAMDTDGCLWNARWDGAAVLRITPDGRIDRVVELPVSKVTDCAFGGADLQTLFVTTSGFGMSDSERKTEPMAGDVFAISTCVDGVEKGLFADFD
jgi:L-arabinonolactonase